MRFVYKKSFIKQFDSYPAQLQKTILEADHQIKVYFEHQFAAYGLGIKKLGPKTFEARVTDKIRIVWIKEGDSVFFALLGTHEEVRRFIKNT